MSVKEKMLALASRYGAVDVEYVANIDGKKIYRPVFRQFKRLGMPIFYAVKNDDVEVINGEKGFEMLGRILGITS